MSVQATLLVFGSLLTVAVNCWVIFRGISALAGEIETLMAGTVAVAVLDAAEFVTDAAVMVTLKLPTGAVGGAV